MSIFKEQHHDQLLLEHLDIDSIKALSLVSKHYYNLTKHILQPFKEFFKIRNKINIVYIPKKYGKPSIKQVIIRQCDNNIMIFIQACAHNNLNIIKYVHQRFKLDIFSSYVMILKSNYINSDSEDDSEELEPFLVYRFVLELAIIRKKSQLLDWLIDLKKYNCGELHISLGKYIPSHFAGDKYRKQFQELNIHCNELILWKN